MDKIKNQHYVPRSYLKRFADQTEQLNVFDKFTGKTFRTQVANVACERFFYDFPSDLIEEAWATDGFEEAILREIDGVMTLDEIREVLKDQLMEKYILKFVDDLFPRVCDDLLQEVTMKRKTKGPFSRRLIHARERGILAFCLTMQFLRTREFRESYEETMTKTGQMLFEASASSSGYSPDEYVVEANKEALPLLHAALMLNPELIELFVQALCRHIWLVGINESDILLYTSDNPVVKHGHIRDPLRGTNGIASPGVEIAFPLSPKVILILAERTHFASLRPSDGRGLRLTKDHVEFYNSL